MIPIKKKFPNSMQPKTRLFKTFGWKTLNGDRLDDYTLK
jgi:hypothetical protein